MRMPRRTRHGGINLNTISDNKTTGTAKRVELLSPAGSMEGFIGAVNAGCDAVYLGGPAFGARAYAENFTEEEIITVIRTAHLHGVRVYMTVNVLVREKELQDCVDMVRRMYAHGLDGVIVQDLGVLAMLRKACPGLLLHASTQLSATLPESARFYQRLGVSRLVPARELSLAEIRAIRQTGIEVEAFIHGAMCYSYSGRCLMSSFLGGRSGNRGRCAGTCRLPYTILDENRQPVEIKGAGKEQYPLSMRDMSTLGILPKLIDAGIDSFKIEGRMKKPEYAAGVTAFYRKYIDRFYTWDAAGRPGKWEVDRRDHAKLLSLYIRAELSEGYYHERNGRDMVTLGKPGYAGANDRLLADIRERYLTKKPQLPIRGKAVILPGQPARLTVEAMATREKAFNAARQNEDNIVRLSDSESKTGLTSMGEKDSSAAAMQSVYPISVTITSAQTVSAAQNHPMTEEDLRKRLNKTGDSAFTFDELEIETDGNAFLPVGALNALRRDALSALEEKLLDQYVHQETCVGDEAGRTDLTAITGDRAARGENPIISHAGDTGMDSLSGNATGTDDSGAEPMTNVLAGAESKANALAEAESKKSVLAGAKELVAAGIHHRVIAQVTTKEQLRAALTLETPGIILDGELPNAYAAGELSDLFDHDRLPATPRTRRIYCALPYIFRENSRQWMEEITQRLHGQIDGWLCRTAEEIEFLDEKGYDGVVIADSSVYRWNRMSDAVVSAFCDAAVLPLELQGRESTETFQGRLEYNILPVYGRLPMMITANCVRKTSGCCEHREDGFWYLEDRKDAWLPVRTDCRHCTNIIYNSVPLSLHGAAKDEIFQRAGALLVIFTNETREKAETILEGFMALSESTAAASLIANALANDGFTMGHYRKGAI
jgi:putative protease